MASDSIAERRTLLTDGLASVEPQIKGLQNKLNDEISTELKAVLDARLTLLKDRRDKIVDSIGGQDAADNSIGVLEDDGFPGLPDMEIPEVLFQELQTEGVADDAAAAGFEAKSPATTITLNLGNPQNLP